MPRIKETRIPPKTSSCRTSTAIASLCGILRYQRRQFEFEVMFLVSVACAILTSLDWSTQRFHSRFTFGLQKNHPEPTARAVDITMTLGLPVGHAA
jgi:hypothetical protein